MTDILATLPDASALSLERIWRLALEQELGLVVEVEPDQTQTVLSIQAILYTARTNLLTAEPTLPLLDFYITLPKDMNLIVIVREPKATLE